MTGEVVPAGHVRFRFSGVASLSVVVPVIVENGQTYLVARCQSCASRHLPGKVSTSLKPGESSTPLSSDLRCTSCGRHVSGNTPEILAHAYGIQVPQTRRYA